MIRHAKTCVKRFELVWVGESREREHGEVVVQPKNAKPFWRLSSSEPQRAQYIDIAPA